MEPLTALRDIRDRLRRDVIPRMDAEPHLQSEVAAMIGILDSVALELRPDDEWCRITVADVLSASSRWLAAVPDPDGADLRRRLDDIRQETSPAEARRLALDAAQALVRTLWRSGALDEAPGTVTDVRRVLADDLRRQLARRR
jgi:hypothetical protein